MTQTLTIIFVFVLGAIVQSGAMFWLFHFTIEIEASRNMFFSALVKRFPYDWSIHCELCRERERIDREYEAEFLEPKSSAPKVPG